MRPRATDAESTGTGFGIAAIATMLCGIGRRLYSNPGAAVPAAEPQQQAAADAQLTGALGRLLAISEAYPQLKADQLFIRLQDELSGTENRIAVSRSDYNAAVNAYNAYIRTFPQKITASLTGAKPRPYYDAPASSDAAPTVDFSKPATPPAAPK